MTKRKKVCVVGSINMDLVTTTDKMPQQGETVIGTAFATYPGGKGANQAVAAARLGADVTLVGAVGEDSFGQVLKDHFQSEGIRLDAISVVNGEATGIASIILSENDNRIIVASGANAKVTPEMVEANKESIIQSDIIIMQFELPMETTLYTASLAREHQIPFIINPAPYHEMPEELLQLATYFTPNELELAAMEKIPLFDTVTDKMIVTRGSEGVEFFTDRGNSRTVPAFQVPVKDTTGAGDTFNGAFAAELASGQTVEQAIQFANATAALSVTKLGAQSGMPRRDEVHAFLKEKGLLT